MKAPAMFDLVMGFAPPVVLGGGAALIATLRLLTRRLPAAAYTLAGVTVALVAAASVFAEAFRTRFETDGHLLAMGSSLIVPGGVTVDRMTLWGELVLCVAVIVIILVNAATVASHAHVAALMTLLLSSAAAAAFMMGQFEMGGTIAALGVITVSTVAIVALERTGAAAVRAAWRCLVLLGVAFASVAYGSSILYAATGSSDFAAVAAMTGGRHLEIFGALFVAVGLMGFATTGPLMRWFCDIAVSANPARVAAAAAPAMLGGGVFLVRLGSAWTPGVWWWRGLIGGLCAASALYAALMAWRDTDVRRVAAYGVSGQMALTLAGLAAFGPGIDGRGDGAAGAATLGVLGVVAAAVAVLSALAAAERVQHIEGAAPYHRAVRALGPAGAFHWSAWLALAGLPPAMTFAVRLLTWQAMISSGYLWVAAVTVVASAGLAIAPLRIIGDLMADAGERESATSVPALSLSRGGQLLIAVICVAPIVGTVVLQPLLLLAMSAVTTLGH